MTIRYHYTRETVQLTASRDYNGERCMRDSDREKSPLDRAVIIHLLLLSSVRHLRETSLHNAYNKRRHEFYVVTLPAGPC